jgi:PHP family Zn ribbon phosphoesterase
MHGSKQTKEVEMTTDAVHPTERWTAKRRVALVGNIRKGEIYLAEGAGGKYGLTVAEVEGGGEVSAGAD